jgi:hypothetical protein
VEADNGEQVVIKRRESLVVEVVLNSKGEDDGLLGLEGQQ